MKYLKKPLEAGMEKDELKLKETVSEIIHNVREKGDRALIDYNSRFEGNSRKNLKVTREELRTAYQEVDDDLIEAMKIAAHNLQAFAEKQRASIHDLAETEITEGVFLSHRVIPVESCCCYVPGGLHPLFSTALMLAIPARVAGVKRITACAPSMRGTEKIHPATLVALDIAQVDEIYVVGGAHSIAAFTFGTEQIKPVDIIVGPGNQYVTEAKRQCYGRVGIDFLAGPSEVLVIADDSADCDVIAADLLAQSEHDLRATAILFTTSEELGYKVIQSVERQLATLETADVAGKSWDRYGTVVVVNTLEEACQLSNEYAPEHLEIQTGDNTNIVPLLANYGSLFVGEYAAEVFGDYTAGTNHTLPTLRASRYTGGLSVGTFLKTCTSQRLTTKGIANIGAVTEKMARAEGLHAHAYAAAIRKRY
ncbi:histidinol dehydrogenase [Candidatus Formimonas warabiya]|uniref:Histidinol dehydrogenase n=1 Tax=Formimonas warabiya TaxID=1761012 RepID=A0A3G1KWF6_FORW1|nr:histidinol dehydrogenase [Candidatus Formimonas warabiya]ATW26776.1 histidinol dehydrogenase [Candidatus Formimonas warabiya]